MKNIYELESGVITSTPSTKEWFKNHKFFTISQSKSTGRLAFRNPENEKDALITTPAQIVCKVNNYIKFATKNSVIQVVLHNDLVVSHSKDYKSIHYGDGYEKHTYDFSVPVSRKYFVQFCIENHPYITKDIQNTAWYQDKVEISGGGTRWVLTHILAYTD